MAHDPIFVNQALLRRCCAGADVLGRRIRILGRWRQIVGLVPDVRLQSMDTTVRPVVYVPVDQEPVPAFSLLVRTENNPLALAPAVRRAILAEDAEQAVSDLRTTDDVISESLLIRRLSMSMLSGFAALSLLLVSVGMYGLVAYSVNHRTHEIGLRMALGAGRSQVLRLVVGRGVLVALAGIAVGIPLALSAARLIRGLLFGIAAFDPLVFVAVPLLLLLIVALAASTEEHRLGAPQSFRNAFDSE